MPALWEILRRLIGLGRGSHYADRVPGAHPNQKPQGQLGQSDNHCPTP